MSNPSKGGKTGVSSSISTSDELEWGARDWRGAESEAEAEAEAAISVRPFKLMQLPIA